MGSVHRGTSTSFATVSLVYLESSEVISKRARVGSVHHGTSTSLTTDSLVYLESSGVTSKRARVGSVYPGTSTVNLSCHRFFGIPGKQWNDK